MSIREELEEVIASVLYPHVLSYEELSKKVADAILINFDVE